MTKYGMVIDLKKCVGCNSCTVACKIAHGLGPGLFFSHVKIGEHGDYPNARMTVSPTLCNHCTKAACVDVCPVGATRKRDDGIVVIDDAKCIGCRYCMIACPYDVRIFIEKGATKDGHYGDLGLTDYERATYVYHQPGTVEKCDFCVDRVDEGKLPVCVQTCPGSARVFGDLDDPESEVSQLLLANNATVLLPEAGTGPNVYYL